MIAPTEEEISKVSQITGIFESMIRTSLDEEETAHIDIDDDVTLLVVDTPVVQVDVNYPEINHFYTMPLGIIFNEKYIITTCLKKDIVVPSLINRLMKNFSTNKHIKLTIQILYRNAANFVTMLKQLNKDSEHVQSKLQESLKNIELFELMNLGKSLVYLSTGLNADILVLEKIKRLEAFKQFEDDVDLIDDAIVENRQAMEMCSIHRDILNGTMDAYASIISNNVNTVMKTLTVVTIVLTIPTLVASIFGMNFDLPFQQNGFWIAIIISIVMASIGGFLLARYTGKTKSRRRNK
jgi:magnesium transporter